MATSTRRVLAHPPPPQRPSCAACCWRLTPSGGAGRRGSRDRTPLSSDDRALVASIAIQAHNEAQHRSGSGYDILTGVYGSCMLSTAHSRLAHSPFSLPAGLSIVLSQGGGKSSSTPVLVASLQSWKRASDGGLWSQYRQNNEQLVRALERADVASLHALYEERLEVMREMSIASHSGILPDELYPILKETMTVEGVVGCGVAGAGGFDSFYALVMDGEGVRDSVERLWSEYGLCMSAVHEEDEGMVVQRSL